MLESPDKTLRVPVLYQRNSLAIRGEVCRVVAADDCGSDVGIVRAVVGLEEKIRLNVLRQNQWETSVDGNPFMRSVGENFIDPSLVWPASFKPSMFFGEEVYGLDGLQLASWMLAYQGRLSVNANSSDQIQSSAEDC